MAKRLSENLTSVYLGAAQRLASKKKRQKIVAYVESYDDILFWRTVLRKFEDETRYFEVMLPSQTSLAKGKKVALMNVLGKGLGRYMIACVDADYDYLMQGVTEISRTLIENPYVFHTYAYAIESYQCYAPALHEVCVMATLNDHDIFDFETFIENFARIIYPLFVWSVWCYRKGCYHDFTMSDFCSVITLNEVNLYHPEQTLESLRRRVNRKINWLQHRYPKARGQYAPLKDELARLGVTPENAYLYVRGHDLHDCVVVPLLEKVCDALRREREREIRHLAVHNKQMQNELASYQHSSSAAVDMLHKHMGYADCPQYLQIRQDIARFLQQCVTPNEAESHQSDRPS